MQPTLVVAAAQPRCTGGDVAANVVEHGAAVRAAGARLVVFPELSLTGYELDAAPVAVDDPVLDPLVRACAGSGSVALVGAPVQQAARTWVAVLRVQGDGVTVAYRKQWLGAAEQVRFSPGDGPRAVEVDGWRVGLGVCRDTGVAEHVAATAALGVDLYAAGLVHHADEAELQDARARTIALACAAPVVLASFAGATGGGYDRACGRSSVHGSDGEVLATAGAEPGAVVRATLTRPRPGVP